jgi:oligopeptide transport system substrate-binding protein
MRTPPLLAAAALALALGAGCSRETNVVRGDREQVLYRGVGYEVATLDPQLATGIAEQTILSSLFEGLVDEDPRDLHPIPGVAESWDVTPDGRVYTFRLRDARWSDGRPVTARDFVESWRRILTPSLGAENASFLYILQGAEAFNRGLTRDFSTVGVQAPDDRTLRVTLDHATPDFLARLTHWAWLPVPVAVIAAHGPVAERGGNTWAEAGNLVGNGAFVLRRWRPDQEIVVEKSPTYWAAARVRLQAIHFLPIDSVDAEEQAFRAGQLHLTDALPDGKIDAYRRDAPQLLRIDPYLDTYYYLINVRRPFLGDARIRRALALAVDRRAIVDRILRGGQQPAESFTPPGLAGYDPPKVLRTDDDAARRLLAEAGHPNGEGLPVFDLLYNNSENHRLIAEAVQEAWRKELGVQVRLSNEEFKTVLEARRTGDFDIMRANWVADYPDPSTFLDLWRSDSGNNFSGWSDPDYDSLIFAAEHTSDPDARRGLFERAERLLLSEVPMIPVYHYTHVFLIRPSVRGWYPNPLDHHPYSDVWLEP